MRMIAQSSESTHPEGEEWSPERQIAHMLELCEAQMESALSESDCAVDALIKAFTGLNEMTRALGQLAEKLPETHSEDGARLEQQLADIRSQMTHAVVAFQFYDKLTQRLGHVRYSLSTLAMFVCDKSQTHQREQWERLFGTLRRLYRTEEEREIFQLMVNGASAEEARAQAERHDEADVQRAANDIELF